MTQTIRELTASLLPAALVLVCPCVHVLTQTNFRVTPPPPHVQSWKKEISRFRLFPISIFPDSNLTKLEARGWFSNLKSFVYGSAWCFRRYRRATCPSWKC